ncbi:hypothetical protein HDF16_005986 [Granulicella aggregans]|uniref:Uncharacterized protein n=1 Tax=Granulicella aggregans TaxID=474949 RepID=A0A7W8E8G1_9BACT|nr:hypothetical protein [Granulicella aggregans]
MEPPPTPGPTIQVGRFSRLYSGYICLA